MSSVFKQRIALKDLAISAVDGAPNKAEFMRKQFPVPDECKLSKWAVVIRKIAVYRIYRWRAGLMGGQSSESK